MAKITFDEAEDADNMPLPVSEEEEEPSSSEATVHQSNEEEEEEEDDSDAPEALSTVNVKSALKDSNKVQRLQQEAERHEKHKQNRKLQKQAEKKQRREPAASTSKSAGSEEVDRLPADLFAQAAAEEQAQAELEAAAKEKQAASKAKSKKRKALTLPEAGSSVTLPRGDVVAHLPSQDSAPSLVPANPTPSESSKKAAQRLVAPFSKRRKVHNTAAANKVASDGSDLPLSLKRADAQLASDKKSKSKNKKGKGKLRPSVDWKARTESTRRSAAMVQGRRDGVGSVHGFVTGQAGIY